MGFIQNKVGRKIIVAATGQIMVVFVVLHLIGNPFNPYSVKLPDIGSLKQLLRVLLILSFIFHAFLGVLVAIENRAAKPQTYVVRKKFHTNFAAESMIWSGILTAAFVIYHLSEASMPVAGGGYIITVVYFCGLTALFLHLYHGIASFFQTVGCNNERTLPVIERIGKGMAVILFGGYIYIVLLNFI